LLQMWVKAVVEPAKIWLLEVLVEVKAIVEAGPEGVMEAAKALLAQDLDHHLGAEAI